MSAGDESTLIDEAAAARQNALAHYSGFKVGAALRGRDGTIHRGFNVENASYGLTMCAERVALYSALAKGVRDFDTIAVVTEADPPSSPCGPCRQLLWEYCGDITVIMAAATTDAVRRSRMGELLPLAFGLEERERS